MTLSSSSSTPQGLLWNTRRLGGAGSENATRVAVNAAGYAFLTGYTSSTELTFPTLNPIQFVPVGGFEALITCLAPDGKSVLFSTFFGGEANDSGVGIALDASGNIYVAGYTDSALMQTVNAFQANNGGGRDGFILKLDSTGQHIVYSTFIGGAGSDGIVGLAVDGPGNAYIAGFTYSSDFPVVSPIQPGNAGAQDAFVAKFNAADIVSSSEFQVSGQGGSVVATTSSSLNPVFGYATANVANGGAPTGLEILDLKTADVTVTEVGILAPRLTTVGRFYVEVDPNTRVPFCRWPIPATTTSASISSSRTPRARRPISSTRRSPLTSISRRSSATCLLAFPPTAVARSTLRRRRPLPPRRSTRLTMNAATSFSVGRRSRIWPDSRISQLPFPILRTAPDGIPPLFL